MRTMKTITLTAIMLLIGSYSIASSDIYGKPTSGQARAGDGKNKHNPRHKQGESIKGYFYRVYGDVTTMPAKDVKFKGPFKRKKMKAFLKKCQKQGGDIVLSPPEVMIKEKMAIYKKKFIGIATHDLIANIHHITLKSISACRVNGVEKFKRKWAAVYLDRDEEDSIDGGIYVDYDHCNSDDRAHLSVGEYSIHYDDNHKCRADLNELSDD